MKSNISGYTKLIGLIGTPIKHSLSPAMHNTSFEALGLDYVYLCFDMGKDDIKTAVEGFKKMGLRGWNVTMPLKNIMPTLCDELSLASKISGAVNTVVNDNGKLTGYTTDGIGFMESCIDAGHDIIGKKMALLGAGGAATAILVQAAIDGVKEISVFSLRDEFYPRVKEIISKLNAETNCHVSLFDFDDTILKQEIDNSDILVNATSVGMAPDVDGCLIKDETFFHDGLIVSDVVYNPIETKLLKMAKQAGCHVFNGTYMTLYQGAESFKLWTGKDMPIDLMKKTVFTQK